MNTFLACTIFFFVSQIPNIENTESDVVVYDDANTFTEELKGKNNFIMFYAPWCGHCKRLGPTWNELAKSFKEMTNPSVVIAKVDCTTETKICSDHDVTGYPTLKFFKGSEANAVRFRGPRDLESLQNFVAEQLVEADAYEEEEEDSSSAPSPLVELTSNSFLKHIETGSHFIKFYAPWCGHCKRLAPTWEEVAYQYKDEESFSIAKVDCTVHKSTCDSYSVKGYPTLLFFHNGEKVDEYEGSRNLADLKGYIDKKIHLIKKTDSESMEEALPDFGNSLPRVFELDPENFDSTISHELTFVKFFAPWCGHCKRLAPVWDELSKRLSDNVQVKIAKVDCTQHREICQQYEVRGYPTLTLFKDGKKVKNYSGKRDVEDLEDFVLGNLSLEGRDEL